MPGESILISNVGATSAPKTYVLPPNLNMDPLAVTATFDGSGSSSSFFAALAFYSQDGLLLGRTFAASPVAPGGSATVTFAPSLTGDAASAGGAGTLYHLISASSTNATLVRAGPGAITGYFLGNSGSTDAYVKLYDKNSAPTVGTDTPKWVLRVPALASANVGQMTPLPFTNGIAFAITGGAADSDTTAVVSNEVQVSLNYL